MSLTALAVLLAGAVPNQPQFFVRVDFAIVNHVRSFTTEHDRWGRETRIPSSTTWLSFWELATVRLPWTGVNVPVALVGRCWWTVSDLRTLTRCEDGWLLESNEGINVIALDVFVISSDYDFELKNRRCFRPLRKP